MIQFYPSPIGLQPGLVRFRQDTRRGFTLLEMLLALSIFALLCGAIYGMMMTTIKTSRLLEGHQTRNETIEALHTYLRAKFSSPNVATHILTLHFHGQASTEPEGMMVGDGIGEVAFRVREQKDGRYELEVSSFKGNLDPSGELFGKGMSTSGMTRIILSDGSRLSWRVLVRDLAGVSFHFRSEKKNSEWVDHWEDSFRRPALVQIGFTFSIGSDPFLFDFWIPTIQSSPHLNKEALGL